MSGEVSSTLMLLQPLHLDGWTRLAPTCEVCQQGAVVAVCWFRLGFGFTSCANCAEQIARAELLTLAMRRFRRARA